MCGNGFSFSFIGCSVPLGARIVPRLACYLHKTGWKYCICVFFSAMYSPLLPFLRRVRAQSAGYGEYLDRLYVMFVCFVFVFVLRFAVWFITASVHRHSQLAIRSLTAAATSSTAQVTLPCPVPCFSLRCQWATTTSTRQACFSPRCLCMPSCKLGKAASAHGASTRLRASWARHARAVGFAALRRSCLRFFP